MKTTIITCDKCRIKIDGDVWSVVFRIYKNELVYRNEESVQEERDLCGSCYKEFLKAVSYREEIGDCGHP